MVYNGAGACDGCGETLGGMLQEIHFEIKYVGGIDPVTHSRVGYLESLTSGELTNIRSFVFHGQQNLAVIF